MRIFRALSHTKSLPIGRFNFSNPATTKMPTAKTPTIVINITTPSRVIINHKNQPKSTGKKDNIDLDNLTKHELQQLIDFVV